MRAREFVDRRIYPGSPTSATTWPCPPWARSAWRSVSNSLASHKARQPPSDKACRRVRTGPAPISSKASTGSVSPLTRTWPSGSTWT